MRKEKPNKIPPFQSISPVLSFQRQTAPFIIEEAIRITVFFPVRFGNHPVGDIAQSRYSAVYKGKHQRIKRDVFFERGCSHAIDSKRSLGR